LADKDKRSSRPPSDPASNSQVEELYRKLQPEMRGPRPNPDAIAAALQAAQRLASEADAEAAAEDTAQDLSVESSSGVCTVCGYQNRLGNKFCGKCGMAITGSAGERTAGFPEEERRPRPIALHPNPFLDPEPEPVPQRGFATGLPPASRPSGQETHHHHHHYHHHYFPGAQEGVVPRPAGEPVREPERMRPTAALRGEMSRAEAGVRRITQEWVLACNTKHLDDLLELYAADALVLRSNYPPVRGAAAVREFFFGALDAGLGEVEIEPLRLDVVGDMAYEAGRWKALVPGAIGKRREERGKYVCVCARQGGGDWRLVADCWSSDLSLTTLESDIPAAAGVKSSQPRKTS